MALNRNKLRAVTAHVISTCPQDTLGAVKLHKVLYYADMLAFLGSGSPITGARYRKRPHGPTCDALLWTLQDMEQAGDIEVKTVDYYGYKKKSFTYLKHERTNQLSADEVELVDDVIDFVCKQNTAATISEFSHDLPWDMVEFGEEIPYHNSIHLIPVEPSPEAMAWAEAAYEGNKVASKNSGTVKSDVESRNARDFRARMAEVCGVE